MSTFLKIELIRSHREQGQINNIRGMGTMIGFDTDNSVHAEIL